DNVFSENIPDLTNRTETGDQVSYMTLLEEVRWQTHQVIEDISDHLEAKLVGKVQTHVFPLIVHRHGDKRQQQKPQRHHCQEIVILLCQTLVDHQLHIERRADRGHLQQE